MTTIKKIYASNENILIMDFDNSLYLMGDNCYDKIGINTHSKAIHSPVPIKITLQKDEDIKLFYSLEWLLVIYTTHNRVFVSRNKFGTHSSDPERSGDDDESNDNDNDLTSGEAEDYDENDVSDNEENESEEVEITINTTNTTSTTNTTNTTNTNNPVQSFLIV